MNPASHTQGGATVPPANQRGLNLNQNILHHPVYRLGCAMGAATAAFNAYELYHGRNSPFLVISTVLGCLGLVFALLLVKK